MAVSGLALSAFDFNIAKMKRILSSRLDAERLGIHHAKGPSRHIAAGLTPLLILNTSRMGHAPASGDPMVFAEGVRAD
jgi:hypothetical protein